MYDSAIVDIFLPFPKNLNSTNRRNPMTESICTYTHQLAKTKWECPHESGIESELCLFHQPCKEKDDTKVTEQFVKKACSEGDRSKEFIGATFGEVDIDHEKIEANDNHPIILKDAEFQGEFSASFTVFHQPLRLQGAHFATETEGNEVDIFEAFEDDEQMVIEREESISAPNYFQEGFEGSAAYPETSFDGGIDLRGAKFKQTILAHGAEFYGVADFWGTQFEDNVSFEECEFNEGLLFDGATFYSVVDFSSTYVGGGCIFERGNAYQEFLLSESHIDGDCIFSHMNFESDASFEDTKFDGTLNLEGSTFQGKSHSINLRFVEICNELNWSFSTIKQPLHMQGARIATETETQGIVFDEIFSEDGNLGDTFEGSSPFPDVGFDGGADFRGTVFEKTVICQNVNFNGVADFWGTEFRNSTSFENCTFNEGVLFDGADFENTVDFSGVNVFHGAIFERIHCGGEFIMTNSTLNADCVFANATFRSDVSFMNTIFDGKSDFSSTKFLSKTLLTNITCYNEPVFAECTFKSPVIFTPKCGKSNQMMIDLSDAEIQSGELNQPADGCIIYNLENATLGDVTLSGKENKSLFSYFKFKNTDFEEFNFGAIREELSDSDWFIHRTILDDNSKSTSEYYSKLETTYLKAKNSAMSTGETKAGAEFFINEMMYRRKNHWIKMTSKDVSLKHSIQSGGKWIANTALMISSGYGERPWRVIGTAVGIIVTFSFLFRIFLPSAPFSSPLGYLILSSESFITLVLGGSPAITDETVRLMANFEGFTGAFLMALFVFTLTRSIER